MPSAWGSTNLATSQSGNGSNIVRGIENCWTITNWRDNSSRGFGAPWEALKRAPYNCVFANATSYRSVTVNDLVKKGAIATVPKSLNGSETVYNVLNSGSDFSKFIITAMLNWAVSPAKSNIQLCTRGTGGANQLVYMAKGTYYPSGGNPTSPGRRHDHQVPEQQLPGLQRLPDQVGSGFVVLWSSLDVESLAIQSWDDEEELVVFDTSTGDTHLLHEFGLAVIRRLTASPRTAVELTGDLAEFFEGGDSDKMLEYTEATLDRLQRTGLVVSSSL